VQLQHLAKAGKLAPTDQLRRVGTKQTWPASNVIEGAFDPSVARSMSLEPDVPGTVPNSSHGNVPLA
jgi:hypothetical protein